MMDQPNNPWAWQVNHWCYLSMSAISILNDATARFLPSIPSLLDPSFFLLTPSQNPVKHKHPSSLWHYSRSCTDFSGLGRTRCLSPHGELSKHGGREQCKAPFAPCAGCLSSAHMSRWLPYTHTLPNTASISIFSLCLSSALIKHWIHVVCCLLFTLWGMKHTSDSAYRDVWQLNRERSMFYVVNLACIHYFKKCAQHVSWGILSFKFYCAYICALSREYQMLHIWFSFIII